MDLPDVPESKTEAVRILKEYKPKLIVRLYDAKKADESLFTLRAAVKEASVDTEIVSIRNADHESPDIDWAELESLARKAKDIWGEERCIVVHCGAGIGGTGTFALLLLAESLRLEGSHSDSKSQNEFLKEYLDKVWNPDLSAL